jgi:hypothetical protein
MCQQLTLFVTPTRYEICAACADLTRSEQDGSGEDGRGGQGQAHEDQDVNQNRNVVLDHVPLGGEERYGEDSGNDREN